MTLFVGNDWVEAHHDVHLMNETGELLAAKQLPEGLEGLTELHGLIAGHATDPTDVVIGIETERGMWVQALIAAGYQVYAINPSQSLDIETDTASPEPNLTLVTRECSLIWFGLIGTTTALSQATVKRWPG